jgi:hypothetical protein
MLLVALFLSMQVVEGTGVHRCTAHDAGLGLQVGTGQASGHHHGATPHHNQGGDETTRPDGCPCLSDCQHSAAAAAAPSHVGQVPASLVASSSSIEFLEPFRSTPQYLLPFANGPPLIA